MASVTFENVGCVYDGAERPSLTDLNIQMGDGEFLVLVGPSGCGKSTTLRLLAGLEQPTTGRILIDGEDVTTADPKARDIAMVFQNYALYPHMTVEENIGFSLKIAHVSKEERQRRILAAAEMLDLTPVLKRKPRALSGGQRQRVAMGRAIVRQPRVFLMDEPLSNLDAKLRVQTRAQILKLTKGLGISTVYVTHDQTEAMTMGDRVAVLKEGSLQQIATPTELYERPRNLFVAGFIGSPAMNFYSIHPANGVFSLGETQFSLPDAVQESLREHPHTIIGVRPEHMHLAQTGGIPVDIDIVEELGSDAYVYAHFMTDGERQEIVARAPGRQTLKRGMHARIQPDLERAFYFDADTEDRIAMER